MQLPIFNVTLRRTITYARYSLYVALCLLHANAVRGEYLIGFVLAPLILHWLSRYTHTLAMNLAVHVTETLTIAFVTCASGVIGLGQFAVVCTLLSGNAALFGHRWLGLFTAACIGAALLGSVTIASETMPLAVIASEIARQPVAAASMLWVLSFTILISLVAHKQAHVLLRSGARIRHVNRSLLRYLPDEVAHHLQRPDGPIVERQWMSVTFVDLVGFTEATRRLPVESLSAVINDFFSNVDQLVRNWGGSVSKFMGDGMLIVFSSDQPTQRQNMARQCTYCVAALAQVLRELNTQWNQQGLVCRFSVTSGVASGYCSVGEWGSAERKDFTVIGTPVNLAARLQHHANASGALIDEVTAALIGADKDPLEIELKGLGPTTAFRIPPDRFAS